MVDREQMVKEQDADLRELAELGMSFARKLEARVELVTSVAEAQALALAFNRIARGVRLTHALRTKLVRDHLEIGKLERSAAQRETERRKAQITAVLDREIYIDPHTQDEADDLSERLTERLDQEALFDGFLNGPLEPLIACLREHLELPDPPPGRSPIEGEHLEGADLKDIRLPEPPAPSLSSPVTTGEGDHPPESGWWRGQATPTAEPSPPPPPALRPAVPLPRSAGEEKKKPGRS